MTDPDRPAPRRLGLIVNAKSADRTDLGEAIAGIVAQGHALETAVLGRDGGPEALIARFLEGADAVDTVLAGGGDGTLDKVFGAAARHAGAARASFGIVPLGTANDFARTADIPVDDLVAALDLVLTTPARPIDLGALEGRPFVNMATGGFGARVTVETDPELKQRFGGLAYVLTGLARAGELHPYHGTFTGEGFSWSGDFVAMAIGNGRQAGGGMALCPDARLDDGVLDLTIIRDVTRDLTIEALAARLFGSEPSEPVRITAKGRWFDFESSSALPVNLDGEPVEMARFSAQIRPGALRLHLGPNAPVGDEDG